MSASLQNPSSAASPGPEAPFAPPGVAALRVSEERYRRLFETAHEGILIVDARSETITDANPFMTELLGWRREELLQKELWEIGLFPSQEQSRQVMKQVRDHGSAQSANLRVLYENGEQRDLSFVANLYPEEGQPIAQCLIRDVTNQRQAEEVRVQLAAILDSSQDAIITLNIDGIVTAWNRCAEKLFGYSATEMIGHSLNRIIPPEQLGDEQRILQRLCNGETVDHDETERLAKDGRRVHLSRTITPLRNTAGAIVGACQISRDITERVEVINQLKAARDAAEAANSAKDSFLAALSHELRTPLTPVLLTAAAMEADHELPEELHEHFAMIRRSVELEAKLIDDLLDLTRITQGKLALQMANIDANAVLEQSLDMLRDDFEANQLGLVKDLSATTSWIHADAVRIQQVFWNILRNALKFTPPSGKVAVRTYKDGEFLHIEISDTGLGITHEELPRIFDTFSQGDEASEPRFGGLGLGLSISAVLVREHHGHIWAESPGRNQGATFHVQLPLAVLSASGRVKLPPPPIKPQPLRILLVEDHQASRDTLARLLSRRGHVVSTSDCIAQAKILAQNGTFDLVVSDLGLPDGTGHDLMRDLVRDYGMRGIALSGFGMAEDIQQSREAGFHEHLTKPVDVSALERAMMRVMESR